MMGVARGEREREKEGGREGEKVVDEKREGKSAVVREGQ